MTYLPYRLALGHPYREEGVWLYARASLPANSSMAVCKNAPNPALDRTAVPSHALTMAAPRCSLYVVTTPLPLFPLCFTGLLLIYPLPAQLAY